MKQILQVRNLNIAFKTQGQMLHAVRGIDFTLQEGEALGIVGESGCGKSSAAKALLRLLPSDASHVSGELIYKHQNIESAPENRMQKLRGREIAMIFQDPLSFLNPTQKVGVQILEGYFRHFRAASQKEGKNIACQLLQELGFARPEEVMEAYPHTLSGGMRQRILIALALICQPKILLADEPTASLDPSLRVRILSLLKRMQHQSKMGIILITHDMSIAASFCDSILVMYAGKIVEQGDAGAVFCNPQHPYTQMLVKSMPSLDFPKTQTLAVIEGVPPSLNLSLGHCAFCSRCPSAMNICAEASPSFMQHSEKHWSACFKHRKRLAR